MRFLSSLVTALAVIGNSAASPLSCDGINVGASGGCSVANKLQYSVNVDAGAQPGATTFEWSSTSSGVTFSDASLQNPNVHYARSAGSCVNKHLVLHVKMVNGDDTKICTVDLDAADDTQPTLTFPYGGEPSPYAEVEVDDVTDAPTATADDDCDADVNVVYTSRKGDSFKSEEVGDSGMYSLTRTWSATDACGNVAKFESVIDVVDTTPPVISAPGDATYDCGSDIPECAATATDNGSDNVNVVFSYSDNVVDGCEHNYKAYNLFTATDENGNEATHKQTITVVDASAPSLGNTPERTITLECEYLSLLEPAQVTATDNCDDSPTLLYSQEVVGTGTIGESYTLHRKWTASDACGNTATFIQTINVEDTKAPTLTIDADSVEECGAHPPLYNNTECVSTVTDKCDDSPSVQMSEEKIPGSCTNEYKLVHSYTVSDNSGNTEIYTRTITVEDNSMPVLQGVPPDLAVPCVEPAAATVLAKDICEPEVTSAVLTSETKLDDDDYNYRLERVWTATDACGHTASGSQTITVEDQTAPSFLNVPQGEISVPCDNIPDPPTDAGSSDTCCESSIDYTQVKQPGTCDEEYRLIRTWVVTDCASNSEERQQILNVQSNQPRLVNMPNDLTEEYRAGLSIPVAGVTSEDNCTSTSPDFTETKVDGSCPNQYDLIRTWVVADDCHSVTNSQTISISDTNGPSIVQPGPRTSTCGPDTTDWTTTATDSSDGTSLTVQVTCDDDVTGSCAHEGSRTCHFSATDVCGNTDSVSATDTWSDDEAPVLTCDGTCAVGSVTVTDNCDSPDIVYTEVYNAGDGCSLIQTRHEEWHATDVCGNVASHKEKDTPHYDTTSPTVTVPDTDNYSCRSDEVTNHGILTGSDTFGNTTNPVRYNQTSRNSISAHGCGFTIKTQWLGQDCALNSDVVEHFAIVNESPTGAAFSSLPGDETLECPETYTPTDLTVSTPCDGDVATVPPSSKTLSTSGQETSVIEYTWSWNDGCQSLEHKATVTISDTTDPEVVVSDATGECNVVEVDATATDTCHGAASCVMTNEDLTGTRGEHCWTAIKTWTCTDNSGNTATAMQTVSATDESAPQFQNAPADKTDQCTTADAVALSYTDNCATLGSSEPTTTGTVIDGMGTVVHTWSATDVCGHSTTHRQTVTVEDTTPPTLDQPAHHTDNCAPTVPTVTGKDSCAFDRVEVTSTTTEAGNCEYSGKIVTTWTAYDASGNTANHTQTTSFQDVGAPTWSGTTDSETTLAWGADPLDSDPASDFTGADNCGEATVSCTHTESGDDSGCLRTFTWTCIVTDVCGLTTSIGQVRTTTMTDYREPELSANPADQYFDCTATIPDQEDLTSPVGTVFKQQTWSGTDDDATTCRTLTRTWSVTHCGRSDSHSQVIYIEDNTAPVITQPAYSDDECSLAPKGSPTAEDDCSGTLEVTTTDSRADHESGGVMGYQITRTSVATDRCGNRASKASIITVVDTTPPVLSPLPEPETIEAPATSSKPAVTSSDNCVLTTDEYTENTVPGGCTWNYTFTRSWTTTDQSGNTAQHDQIVTYQDTQPPQLNGLPPAHVPVDYADWSDYETAAVVTATDAADGTLSVDLTEVFDNQEGVNNFTVYRTWFAEDECGHGATFAQTIVVTSPPACEPPHLEISCEEVPKLTDEFSTDVYANNCSAHLSNDVVVTPSEATVSSDCEDTYTIVRTYTISDEDSGSGGQTIDVYQTITVGDDKNPEIQEPALSVVPFTREAGSCDPEFPTITATDNCDDDVTVEMGPISKSESVWSATYTATDNCGNTDTYLHQFDLTDERNPYFDTTSTGWSVSIDTGCGWTGGDDGECGVEAQSWVFINGQSSRDIPDGDVQVCKDFCDTVPECAGFALDKINNKCNFKRSVSCNVNSNVKRDCYIKHPVDSVDNNICSEAPATTLTCSSPCDATCTVAYSSIPVAGDCTNSASVTRKWVGTDSRGKTVEHEQTFAFKDEESPVVTANDDVTCECGELCVLGASANDVCDGALPVSGPSCTQLEDTDTYTSYECVYTATDECGNTHSDSMTKTEMKDLPPYWETTVSDYTSECIDTGVDTPVATDHCDAATTTVTFTDDAVAGTDCAADGILYTKVRTFTATDSLSQQISQQQTITVYDNAAPQLIGDHLGYDGHHAQCEMPVITVTSTDNCRSGSESVEPVSNPLSDLPAGSVELTWSVTDDCGKTTSETITVRVYDTTPPTIDARDDVNVDCGDAVPAVDTPGYNDNCPGVTLDFTEDVLGTPCEGQTTTRTWTATDATGNTHTETQVVNLATRKAPKCTIAVPEEHIDCTESFSDPGISCVDECTDVSISFSATPYQPGISPTCNGRAGTKTWITAADDCGRTTTIQQPRSKLDTTPPAFDSFPADSNVPCSYEDYTPPTCSDDCGPTTINSVPTGSSTGCGGTETIAFTCSDECGQTDSQTLTRVWFDNEKPQLSEKPIDVTLECTDDLPVYEVTATDNCIASPQVVYNTRDIPLELVTWVSATEHSWTVQDDCGQEDTHTATVIVKDRSPPVLEGNFETVVVECMDFEVPEVAARDDCWSVDEITVTKETTVDEVCGVTGTTVIKWTATDGAGMSTEKVKTVTVVDVTAPTLTFSKSKDDITVECDEGYIPPVCTAQGEGCEGAASPECETTSSVLAQTATTSVTEYTYSSADECGNRITTRQTVTVRDTQEPVITFEGLINKDCADTDFVPTATAEDLCDENPTLTSSTSGPDHDTSCDGAWTQTWTWTATDEKGNTQTRQTNVIYSDSKAPTLTVVGDDETRECDDVATDPTATCSDDCASCITDVVKTDDSCSGSPCQDGCQVTFVASATDDCGNAAADQTIIKSYLDTTPPTLTVTGHSAESTTISAGDDFSTVVALPTVVASDNCDTNPSVVFDENQSASEDACTATHIRTWTATDACGLSATYQQTIHVEEDVKPELHDVVDTITVECGDSDWLSKVPKPHATDRAGHFIEVSDRSSEESTGDCSCDKQYIVVWSATDDCSNTITASTTVVVDDTVPPAFTCVPDDLYVQCAAEKTDATVYATDASVAGTIEATVSHVDLDIGCGGNSVVRTYRVSDCSGNENTHVQTIIVKDDQVPQFSRKPADIEVECGCDTVPPQYSDARPLKAIDNCDSVFNAVPGAEETIPGEGSEYKLVRSYSATDSCGNGAEIFQTISVVDNKAPTFHGCADAQNAELACDQVSSNAPDVSISDECDESPDLTMTEVVSNNDVCANSYTLTRTWTATDASGNSDTTVQVLTVYDTEAPQLLPLSDPDVATCLSPNDKFYVEDVASLFPWFDNCDSDENVELELLSCNSTEVAYDQQGLAFTDDCVLSADKSSISIRGEVNHESADRTYTIYATLSDSCGNQRSVSQSVTVKGTVAAAAEAGCAVPDQESATA